MPLHDTIGNCGERLGVHLIAETPTGDAYVNPRPVAVVRQASGVGRDRVRFASHSQDSK